MINLSNEILFIIINKLCIIDLIILEKTCKLFKIIVKIIINNNQLYKKITNKKYKNINDLLYYLVKHKHKQDIKSLIKLGADDFESALYAAGISGDIKLINHFKYLGVDNDVSLACGLIRGHNILLVERLIEINPEIKNNKRFKNELYRQNQPSYIFRIYGNKMNEDTYFGKRMSFDIPIYSDMNFI